jgi:amidase
MFTLNLKIDGENPMQDTLGAFMKGEPVTLQGADHGPLAGLSFAAKDVFDIAGHPTSNGQPTWPATHPLPTAHAGAVQQLLDAGASLAGKTVCDEMCYSLAGDNAHYGAPINPAAPDRAVGGSSSGSAAAVAGSLVDFALGTDCGGSVRCPASFSGIYGLRPTHDRVDASGVAPLAESFDVVGWFAREAALFADIGGVLLDGNSVSIKPKYALVVEDAFSRMSDPERGVSEMAAESAIETLGLQARRITVATEGLDRWFAAFRHLQALEIWQNHADWVSRNNPAFGPGVKERFAYAATLTDTHRAEHQPVRDLARARLDALLGGGDAILVLPTAPISPKRDASVAEVEDFRARTMGLTCLAGLSGCPQASLPLADAGAPLGLSLLGPRGSDEILLNMAVSLEP